MLPWRIAIIRFKTAIILFIRFLQLTGVSESYRARKRLILYHRFFLQRYPRQLTPSYSGKSWKLYRSTCLEQDIRGHNKFEKHRDDENDSSWSRSWSNQQRASPAWLAGTVSHFAEGRKSSACGQYWTKSNILRGRMTRLM